MAIGKHYDLDTDVTLTGNSDIAISSQKAVKTYADTKADPTIFRDENSDTPVKELVINRLTDEEYDVIVKNDTELYLTPDTTDQDISNAINAHNISNSAHSALFNAKQDTLVAQTAYTSKGSATKVPQITTNTLGQVTGITEVDITQPTVNNNTITIQKNSTTVDSFTLNQSTDKSINIEVPTTTSSVTSDSTEALTSGGAYTNLVRRKSTTAATGGVNQGVYVDANGQVQTCNATTSTYSSTGTTAVNGTAVASALGSYIPRNFNGGVSGTGRADGVIYGTAAKPVGYFTNFNLLHSVEDKFFGADRDLKQGDTPATITCNYSVTNMVDGNYSGYNTSINPSTEFSTTPFVWEITRTSQFEVTDVCNLYLVGHRLTYTMNVTDYKLEVAYKYSGGVFSWGTIIDYSGSAINILNKHYGLYYSDHGGTHSYHGVFGVRLTISGATSTAFSLSEVMLLCSRGTERVTSALNTIDCRNGGKVTGNITIPSEYGSFVGDLTGTASKATADADGNTIASTYLKSHQSIKTLNTDNTTGQTTSSSETIAGSGTINLHKISKTGTFSDLVSKPTTISGYGITDAYTKTEVDGMISSVYKPAGSVAFASLPTLASNVLGNVYNVTDAFTTTSDFVEGAGKSYPAGTNVVVIEPTSGTYKFDVLAGFVDLSGYVPTSRTVNGKALSADITLSKSDVGLGNVDNTSDADKPISTATQNALDAKVNNTNIINGAPLSNTSSYFFATSGTAAATVQKEVSIPSITALNAGQIIIVKPTVTSTVADSTIKLNNFDAYPMRYNNAAITTSTDSVVWNANFPSIWVFDGTYWVFAGHGLDSNTTYSNMSISEGTTATVTTGRLMRSDYLKQIIHGTVLTDLDTTTATVIDATDTILSALGKLQAQINDRPEYSAVFVDWSD